LRWKSDIETDISATISVSTRNKLFYRYTMLFFYRPVTLYNLSNWKPVKIKHFFLISFGHTLRTADWITKDQWIVAGVSESNFKCGSHLSCQILNTISISHGSVSLGSGDMRLRDNYLWNVYIYSELICNSQRTSPYLNHSLP
jgi:hypothetical protein